ncbi:MAG: DNA polymerase III subunit delta [Solirubrobacterales bacterium]
MKPAFLVAGTDEAKIAAARRRLRSRAEAEGGPGALQVFDPPEGRGAPAAEDLVAAIPALSLTTGRRYLLADHVERWSETDQGAVAEALASLPDELTVVLVAHGKAGTKIVKAVREAGGEVLSYDIPRQRDLPGRLVVDAAERGYKLDPGAARLLAQRIGANPLRLACELDRLALWAGDGGRVAAEDLEAMISDTSEAAAWSLSDALLEADPEQALAISERLLSQGEGVTGLVYALASRLRKAHAALEKLEEGNAPKQVGSQLGMHPYAAKQLLSRLRDCSPEQLRDATAALADLEVWCRGGAEYGEALALTLTIRRVAGVAA